MDVVKSPNGYIFYHYIPTKPGAIVVATLFALGALAVIWRSVTTRTRFAIPFIVGCIRKFAESPSFFSLWYLVSCLSNVMASRGRWIHRTSDRKRHRKLTTRPFRPAERSAPHLARVVCRLDLHDTCSSHPQRPRRATLLHSAGISYVSLRSHRCRVVPCAGDRWRTPIKQELQQKHCTIHRAWWSGDTNFGVWSICSYGFDLACAHETASH